MGLTYRPPTEADAELLLRWRLRPDIAVQMFSRVENDLDKQRAWIRRSNERSDYVHRIMQVDGVDVGYGSITITEPAWGIATLGAYMGDRRGRTGAGPLNFTHFLNHVFYTLGLRKVVNQIFAGNDRVLRGQTMLGYRHVGLLRQHALTPDGPRDLHLFEMLAEDWQATRRKFGEFTDLDGRLWP